MITNNPQEEIDNFNLPLDPVERPAVNLKYPISTAESTPLSTFTAQQIMDYSWNKYFYYNTGFESLDGYRGEVVNSGSRALTAGGGIIMQTGATNNSKITIERMARATIGGDCLIMEDILKWDKVQRFRATFALSSIAAQTTYITRGFAYRMNVSSSTDATPIVVTTAEAHGLATGDRVIIANHLTNTAANGTWTVTYVSATTISLNSSAGSGAGAGSAGDLEVADLPYFGFKIGADDLKGVCQDNSVTGESTLSLKTLSANTVYTVEAQYIPAIRCDFFIRDNTSKQLIQLGSLSTNLPKTNNTHTGAFFRMAITNQTAANKQLAVSFFEYQQER